MKFINARVFMYSGGCTSNWLDGQQLMDFLTVNNHQIVHDPRIADTIIFNTCSVDKIAEEGSLKKIDALIKINPEARVIITGCIPINMKNKIPGSVCISARNMREFNSIFDHPNKSLLDIKRPSKVDAPPYWTSIEKYFTGDADSFKEIFGFKDKEIEFMTGLNEKAFIIEISQGCLGNCSFCAIKRYRGGLKSISLEKAMESFKVGLGRGYRNFKIWGDDVGDYGKDIGIDLSVLLAKLLKIKGDFKLEVLATNPKSFLELYDKLLPSLMDKRMECLNITVQSGSERVLKKMNREIDIKLLVERINDLKKKCPHLILRSHYMVGFPGESKEDFEETIKFIFATKIFQGLVFEFDLKQETKAALMKDHIPAEIRKERRQLLEAISRWGASEYFEGNTY
jgi:MiaB/RimO family radical SAM methylthiotransferase